jgi:hypothetical protein
MKLGFINELVFEFLSSPVSARLQRVLFLKPLPPFVNISDTLDPPFREWFDPGIPGMV